MKIVFWGHNSFGELVLKYLINSGHKIPLIITPTKSSVDKINTLKAYNSESEIVRMGSVTSQQIIKKIKGTSPDIMLSCSFKEKIPEELIEINGIKIINIHGALLPEYRGANMLNWVLIKGCNETGITMHYMDKTLDSGDIISQVKYPIDINDDAVSLKRKMFIKVIELLDDGLHAIANNRRLIKQNHTKGYYYFSRKPDDGKISWEGNAIDIYNLVRALVSPFPGAFSYYMNKKYIIDKAEVVFDNLVHYSPGKIMKVRPDYIIVSSHYNLVKILEFRDHNIGDLPFKVGGCFE